MAKTGWIKQLVDAGFRDRQTYKLLEASMNGKFAMQVCKAHLNYTSILRHKEILRYC